MKLCFSTMYSCLFKIRLQAQNLYEFMVDDKLSSHGNREGVI